MLRSCVRMPVSICHARVRYPYKCCFISYYYIDSCNIRYAPNRSIWHLKFQKFPGVIPPDPQGGRGRREGATPSRTHPQAPPVSEPTLPKAFPQIRNYHYTPECNKCNYLRRRLPSDGIVSLGVTVSCHACVSVCPPTARHAA